MVSPLDSSLVSPTSHSLAEGLPLWRRSLDLACALFLLPPLALATLALAVLVGVTSPGPLFYRQESVGHRGRRFGLLRFRTMHVRSARAGKTPSSAGAFMPGGRLLRTSGLADLPAVLNLLRGEITLVGPAPWVVARLHSLAPERHRGLDRVPGLSGVWRQLTAGLN